ncbi:hypothetical protein BU24DRAFT_404237 [Aaosphaeria arxii CBS 175.79]|uniref:Secreted protein n=1 Tax=Aaosphaeria arxii CBS 175.79 TaxID=1450172 RepID=A0A6A5Y7J4_9PLEO|nr:uncharacterized protein BU24DRAFT_404237 [Aaosphaeria arxii CBS 175.79]KAF2021193.1 hypothetical protein BU24DRAFT_404237 [Aaosphaeria arxii CBS 175.79]
MVSRKAGFLAICFILLNVTCANPVEQRNEVGAIGTPNEVRAMEKRKDDDEWIDFAEDAKNYDKLIKFKPSPPIKGAKKPKSPPIIKGAKTPKRELVTRAPQLYTQEKLRLLKKVCDELVKSLQPKDFVLFVGNSGSYMKYCFEHPRMGAIPISKARRYEYLEPADREDDPENYGVIPGANDPAKHAVLMNYYNRYLGPKLKGVKDGGAPAFPNGLAVDRFVLVDHSSSGKSVDATRIILYHAFSAAKPYCPEIVAQKYDEKPFVLFNVIDTRKTRKNSKGKQVVDTTKVINPVNVPVIKHFWVGKNHEVDHMLGDEGHHFRNQVDYWPSRWYNGVGYYWDIEKEKKQQADSIRNQIKEYVKKHNKGNLMTPSSKTLKSSK